MTVDGAEILFQTRRRKLKWEAKDLDGTVFLFEVTFLSWDTKCSDSTNFGFVFFFILVSTSVICLNCCDSKWTSVCSLSPANISYCVAILPILTCSVIYVSVTSEQWGPDRKILYFLFQSVTIWLYYFASWNASFADIVSCSQVANKAKVCSMSWSQTLALTDFQSL